MSRYAYIDAIRAIAALLVIYFHFALAFLTSARPVGELESDLFFVSCGVFDFGKIGVTLFFAVSGFVIPFSLLSNRQHTSRNFIIGRIFRLYPAYWVSLFAAGCLAAYEGHHYSPIALAANIAMLQDFVRQPTMQGLYWTLQIEIIFYVICFCLFLLGLLDKLGAIRIVMILMLVAAITMAAARLATGRALPVALPLALFVMFFGMIWRRNIIDHDPDAKTLSTKMIVAFAIGLPVIAIMAYRTDDLPGLAWLRYIITYYSAVSVFIILTTRIKIQSKILAYLGALSYSIYLFGALVQVSLEKAFPAFVDGTMSAHVLVLATYAVTIALAAINHAVVEQPSIRLGKKLMGYWDRRSPKTEQLSEVI